MTGMLEMMLMKAMSATASREESRKRKKSSGGRTIVCSVCRTYGGTMYKRGNGYICRNCRRKEEQRE